MNPSRPRHRTYVPQGQRRVDGGSVPRRSFAWLISARSPTVGRNSDKAARLRTLARRVELYRIAWRGDVETPIRINEADAIAARAMLGLPPAIPADEVANEIATLSL